MRPAQPITVSTTGSRPTTRATPLRRWLLPTAVFLIFAATAWLSEQAINSTLESEIQNSLTTLLKADVKAMTIWLESEKAIVTSVARQPYVNRLLNALFDGAKAVADEELESLPNATNLLTELAPIAEAQQLAMLFVTDRSGRLIASSTGQSLGERIPLDYAACWDRIVDEQSIMISPHECSFPAADLEGNIRLGVPIIIVAGPILDGRGNVAGALCFALRPEDKFTEVLSVARSGTSGETYAVDKHGLMLSESRFEAQLRDIDLLQAGQHSSLTILVRDPGDDMTQGHHPEKTPLAQPLTFSAARMSAAAQENIKLMESTTTPFRDYRGVQVVGAWQWMPEYQFGIISEVDDAEAHAPIRLLRTIVRTLIGILGVALLGVSIYSTRIGDVWRRLRRAEKKLESLGQYELLEKIGSGGMGEVFRAKHAMLRRDTAVKLLRPSVADETAISRFEREVQAASQLTNANTIQIYDYGRTPDGLFYYAMEFLQGINLSELILETGPLGDGRTIYILKQVCLSLAEAHDASLIHRDIKPSNLILNHRGGVGDCVKVVDFGLVRSLADCNPSLTLDGGIAGTPAYMSPEASQTPLEIDFRSDIYSLGCVAFFLLTGRPPYQSNNPIEVCWKQVREAPPQLASLLPSPIAHALEELIMRALAKNPDDRPQSASAMFKELAAICAHAPWTLEDANTWWNNRQGSEPPPQPPSSANSG